MTTAPSNIIGLEVFPGDFTNRLQYSILNIQIRLRETRPGQSGALKVYIRTNLNQGRRIRRQFIDQVEKGQSYSTDYYDIPARWDGARKCFCAEIVLFDVGFFEFKPRAESSDPKNPWVYWADGPNIGVTVTPLEYGRDNAVYCAFIRQYGRNKHLTSLANPELEEQIRQLENQGSCVIPPCGNFESFKNCLPFIINELGMRIIHFLPINPVPVSYGRMGMYGSPYATTDYFGIDQSYGRFSRYKTIEDQFSDLTSTIHGLGARAFLDMVINHTGWPSSLLFTHRQWFKTAQDGKLISPGAWGVIWGDLVELDYGYKDLWKYMAGVFLAWCERGIDGFRLDAGYMIPIHVWQYIISRVREEYPNTMFLLEGLGGPWETTEALLTRGMNNWAYSELFQNYSKEQITWYLDYATKISLGKGALVHYAETHDNDRLAKKGPVYTLMRLYVCAFTSFSGAWGFTNGVEWLATEKINVHRNSGLNWGNPVNLVGPIARINRILAENPAFWHGGRLKWITCPDEEVLLFKRNDETNRNEILCAINLNIDKSKNLKVKLDDIGWKPTDEPVWLYDLLRNHNQPGEDPVAIHLEPGGCMLIRRETSAEPQKPATTPLFSHPVDKTELLYRILLQRFEPHEIARLDQAALLDQINNYRRFIALTNLHNIEKLRNLDLVEALNELTAEQVDQFSSQWSFREANKTYVVSGDKWLVVHTYIPCTASLYTTTDPVAGKPVLSADSIANPNGPGYLVFFPPWKDYTTFYLRFNWKIRQDQMIMRQYQPEIYPILSAPSSKQLSLKRPIYPVQIDRRRLKQDYASILLANGAGNICQISARPGILTSKYDTLFNYLSNPANPASRMSLVRTVRETVQLGHKFFDLDESFLIHFTRYNQPVWLFEYDDGKYFLRLERSIILARNENRVIVHYKVHEANTPVHLTAKCCVEYRSIHEQFKRPYDTSIPGIEKHCRMNSQESGFIFRPDDACAVYAIAEDGRFIMQPHWIGDVDHPIDRENGLENKGDLFAPGVFHFELHSNQNATIRITDKAETGRIKNYARILQESERYVKQQLRRYPDLTIRKDRRIYMLTNALDQFVIRCGDRWQVVAGYPWLAMRSRDTLHCVGGLLAAGYDEVVRDVITQVAATVKFGLPSEWIGFDSGRMCCEAALRLILAAQEYVNRTGRDSFWDVGVSGGQTLRQVLQGILDTYLDLDSLAPTVDPDSALLFCDAGMTWMNTNHPQATPRRGYPIEIQALWYQALAVMARITPDKSEQCRQLRETIVRRFLSLYWSDARGYLADNLLNMKKTIATEAVPDSSLRPNQLYAIKAGLIPTEQAATALEVIGRRLVIPAAVRTLSEDHLPVPLYIHDDEGKLLADPNLPYQGRCSGYEHQRRVAYHNGTAWPHLYPLYIEARRQQQPGKEGRRQALTLLEPVWTDLTTGGLGTLAEMKDGNTPHTPRGCYAYALSVAETLRVYLELKYPG